ncbi:hypothetical protein DFQ08_106117 [Winogradskyella arenosi]|uniref:Uncharacterized protein n=1 Tax=Winogradskyella arenosi TaxID=533325 RepID=A0A368ZB02_9FLAO|nr:hypothetical protein DFQ08_106117 [Winogradskyella arenosi]
MPYVLVDSFNAVAFHISNGLRQNIFKTRSTIGLDLKALHQNTNISVAVF